MRFFVQAPRLGRPEENQSVRAAPIHDFPHTCERDKIQETPKTPIRIHSFYRLLAESVRRDAFHIQNFILFLNSKFDSRVVFH